MSHWGRKNLKTLIRNHSKSGWWTLPDIDNISG